LRTDQRPRPAPAAPPLPSPSLRRPAALAGPPRRAVVTVVATAIGLVLLFSFKTPDSPTLGNGAGPIAIGSPRPGSSATTGPRPTQSPGLSAAPSVPGSSVAPSAPGASASAATGGRTAQVDGDVIPTRFGDVQVEVVESGGKITDVKALQLPFDRRRSNEISQYSEPILRSEVLQAQSAQIDSVSGATYTSDAYVASLQSALDRAGG
jgi:uncharacterized protein with FMN-binding domain